MAAGARAGLNLLAALVLAGCAMAPAQPAAPAAFCRAAGTDDTLRPIPAALVPQVNAAFGTALPAAVATRSTVYRCDAGDVLVCSTGANLPCGKADTSRQNAGATAWCRQHPDASVVPAFATGHASIFAWRCQGTRAAIDRQVFNTDPRGFVAEVWRRLPAPGQ